MVTQSPLIIFIIGLASYYLGIGGVGEGVGPVYDCSETRRLAPYLEGNKLRNLIRILCHPAHKFSLVRIYSIKYQDFFIGNPDRKNLFDLNKSHRLFCKLQEILTQGLHVLRRQLDQIN